MRLRECRSGRASGLRVDGAEASDAHEGTDCGGESIARDAWQVSLGGI